jgi:hypothetical protein
MHNAYNDQWPKLFCRWATMCNLMPQNDIFGIYKRHGDGKENIGLNEKFLRFRRDGPFLKRLVTCDEKWIFYDNVIRKRQ